MIAAGATLRTMREQKPLVHQITNYVVMNETAHATLAPGARPVMAHAGGEVEERGRLGAAPGPTTGTPPRPGGAGVQHLFPRPLVSFWAGRHMFRCGSGVSTQTIEGGKADCRYRISVRRKGAGCHSR